MDDGCRCEAIAKRERESEMERWCRTDDLCSYWMYWCFLRGSPKSSKSLDNFRIESHGFGMFWGSPKKNPPYGHGSMIILVIIQMPQVKFLWTERSWNVDAPIPAWMRKPRRSGRCFVVADGAFSVVWHVWHDVHISDDLMDYIIWILCRKSFANPQNGQMMAEISFSLQSGCCNYSTACLVESRRSLLSRKQLLLFFLRTFQEPKLRYLPYVGSMSGDMPQEYGFIWYGTSILGSWTFHWFISLLVSSLRCPPGGAMVWHPWGHQGYLHSLYTQSWWAMPQD